MPSTTGHMTTQSQVQTTSICMEKIEYQQFCIVTHLVAVSTPADRLLGQLIWLSPAQPLIYMQIIYLYLFISTLYFQYVHYTCISR